MKRGWGKEKTNEIKTNDDTINTFLALLLFRFTAIRLTLWKSEDRAPMLLVWKLGMAD